MITYKECLEAVGYNEIGAQPEPIVEYLAYKNGEVRRCSNEKEARSFSSLVERITTNKDEIDTYLATLRSCQSKASDIFEKAIKSYLVKTYMAPNMSTDLWNLCWSAAYDRSHSDGYDNVAQSAQHYVDFADKVIKISERDVK